MSWALLIAGAVLWAGAGHLAMHWVVRHFGPAPCVIVFWAGYLCWPFALAVGVYELHSKGKSLIPPPLPEKELDEIQVMERLAKGPSWLSSIKRRLK